MKRVLTLIMTLILVFTLAACSTGVSSIGTSAGAAQSASQTTDQVTSITTAAGSTAETATTAEVLAENQETHEQAADAEYDLAGAAAITLNGTSITADAASVKVSGSQATITAAGDYVLTGSLADGQIVVNASGDGTVRLALNGVDLRSATSAPIYIQDADKVVILLAAGTANTVTDGSSYTFDSPEEEEPNAAIFSKADLSIYGEGALVVNANFQDGIASKDGLVIGSGAITVQAVDDGIRGKDYLVVEGGSLTVNAGGDGLKSDNEEDATAGYISVSGGSLVVTAGGDALSAQTDATITGGELTLTTGGGSGSPASEAASAKGIKGDASVTIDGGTFTIDAADDAIHSNGSVTVNGGVFSLASGDDGIHADAALTINGGEIQVAQSYEGIESAVITLNDGQVRIAASDDGVNAGGGNDGASTQQGMGGFPGGPGQDQFAATAGCFLYIRGGYLYVDAYGDGIDVNGAIEMSDGVVVVNGPTEQMNGALDWDAGFTMTGGFLAAAGSSGMAMTTGQTSSQPAALIYLAAAQPAGTLVHIQNSAGEDVLTFAPAHDFQSIAFSSAKLVQGETYTVLIGGSAGGEAIDGLYTEAAVTGGTQAASFTVAGIVTTAGTGGRMGGPGGGRRP